jgi:Polyketide cyclase / dehydrase and lipid transport
MSVALQLTYAVDVDASREFAWAYRTDIATWHDPPATFTMDGPFVAGARGMTTMPGRPPIDWRVADVRPPEAFVFEMPLDGAALTIEWRFEALALARTRMTQTITLHGPNAQAFAGQVEAAFGATLADGMTRIAADLTAAASRA